MRHRTLASPLLLGLLLLAAACGRGGRPVSSLQQVPLRYAANLSCQRGQGYSLWTLRNPWDTTAVLHSYLLVSDSAHIPPSLNTRHSTIRVPVRTAGVATAVHCGLLDELGVATAIAGVCEKEYIDLPAVSRGLAQGTIADFGNAMNPNIERIIDVAPDVLLLTPFEHSGGYGRAQRIGIPIIECAEYMEVSPLARAEWIRFYAELFGVPDRGDSIFAAVERDYQSLRRLAGSATSHPTVLTELPYAGQWFLPCGQSTMGIMFADAAARYIFRDLEGSGSKALPLETVFDSAHDADIWLVKYNAPAPLTYRQLAADNPHYTRFRAFRQRHIYACDLAHNHFYEQTPFHPERLLRDLIAILHPGLLPTDSTTYYRPLSE